MSTGGFAQPEWSPCIYLKVESRSQHFSVPLPTCGGLRQQKPIPEPGMKKTKFKFALCNIIMEIECLSLYCLLIVCAFVDVLGVPHDNLKRRRGVQDHLRVAEQGESIHRTVSLTELCMKFTLNHIVL